MTQENKDRLLRLLQQHKALEQFELCLKLKKEQGSPQHTEESIHGSELKVAQLKELMNK